MITSLADMLKSTGIVAIIIMSCSSLKIRESFLFLQQQWLPHKITIKHSIRYGLIRQTRHKISKWNASSQLTVLIESKYLFIHRLWCCVWNCWTSEKTTNTFFVVAEDSYIKLIDCMKRISDELTDFLWYWKQHCWRIQIDWRKICLFLPWFTFRSLNNNYDFDV